jgi:hypothetical protein
MTHLDAVLNAAEERDLALLSSAIKGLTDEAGTEGAQAFIRSQILPQLTLRAHRLPGLGSRLRYHAFGVVYS